MNTERINKILTSNVTYILFYSSGSFKHKQLWEEISSLRCAYRFNIDHNKDLASELNVRVTPCIYVFEKQELANVYLLNQIKGLREYVECHKC